MVAERYRISQSREALCCSYANQVYHTTLMDISCDVDIVEYTL